MADTEHDKLKPLEGTFRAQVRIWMGAGDPAVLTGTMVNEFEFDDRFLRQTYRGDPSGGPLGTFEGRGYRGYNEVTKEFESFWIDRTWMWWWWNQHWRWIACRSRK